MFVQTLSRRPCHGVALCLTPAACTLPTVQKPDIDTVSGKVLGDSKGGEDFRGWSEDCPAAVNVSKRKKAMNEQMNEHRSPANRKRSSPRSQKQSMNPLGSSLINFIRCLE